MPLTKHKPPFWLIDRTSRNSPHQSHRLPTGWEKMPGFSRELFQKFPCPLPKFYIFLRYANRQRKENMCAE